MEIYLQELDCAAYLAAQSPCCRQAMLTLGRSVPGIGAQAIAFLRAGVPALAWPGLRSPSARLKRPGPA
eukprot:7168504-Alexandrium_andersonii.AAC.1